MEFRSNIKEFDELKKEMSLISKGSYTYEKLAHYIEKNYKHIIFMTASEVAKEADVSQGSVSRFCSALGYRGYNDFLHNLQQFMREEITAPQRLEYTSHNKDLSNVLNMEHSNIDELHNILNEPSYQKLVDKIVTSKEIVLLSSRMSATLLPYAGYLLSKIRNNVEEVTAESHLWNTLELRNPETTFIFTIVFPRYPNDLISKLRALKKEGFYIAALTDSAISPVADIADNVITVPITTSSIFDIYSTPMLLINLLLKDAANCMEGLNKRLDKLEKIEKENNTYYRGNS